MYIASTKNQCHYRLQLVSGGKDPLVDYIGLDAFH